MIILAWILWIAMWGAAGYFTVRAILNIIENRRMTKQLNHYRSLLAEIDCALEKES